MARSAASPSPSPSLSLTTLILGAVALAASPAAAGDRQQNRQKPMALETCYGIARAGENQCAHAFGDHTCAGQSEIDYDGGDWVLVPLDSCQDMDGRRKPFNGINRAKKDQRS